MLSGAGGRYPNAHPRRHGHCAGQRQTTRQAHESLVQHVVAGDVGDLFVANDRDEVLYCLVARRFPAAQLVLALAEGLFLGQRDPACSLKSMDVFYPSHRERGAGRKRRWAFGDRSHADGQSPKGGWPLQTPLAHKEKGPARDLFSGLQCASGGGNGSDIQPSLTIKPLILFMRTTGSSPNCSGLGLAAKCAYLSWVRRIIALLCSFSGRIRVAHHAGKTSTGPLPQLVGGHQPAPAFWASLRRGAKCKQAPSL